MEKQNWGCRWGEGADQATMRGVALLHKWGWASVIPREVRRIGRWGCGELKAQQLMKGSASVTGFDNGGGRSAAEDCR